MNPLARQSKEDVRLPPVDPASFDKYAVFDAIGYTPDRWQKIFHDSESQYRFLACGVRVGKTFCLAAEATAAAVCPSKKSLDEDEWVGSRVWIVAPTYDIADKLFSQVVRNLKRYFPWLVVGYSRRERLLRTLGGGYVQAKSADNEDSLVSEELDAAVLDEAPRIPEQAKENVRQRLITRDGWMAAIGSPVPCKWFQRDFARGQARGYSYEFEGEAIAGADYAGKDVVLVDGEGPLDELYFSMRVPTHANHRLDVDTLHDFENTMPDRIYQQDILAEFMSTDGQVFEHFEHLAVAQRLNVGEADSRYVVGWDVARVKDYSVLSVIDVETREQVFIDRFRGPWQSQLERVEKVCRRFNRPDLVVDATGKGDPLVEEIETRNRKRAKEAIQGEGEAGRLGPFVNRVEGIVINSNSVKRDLVENLSVGFDQGEVKILNERVQLQELRLFEFKASDSTGIIRYGAPPGFHDDTVMALALAWWRASRPRGTSTILLA